MLLKGLHTAVITPFDSQGKIDEIGLRFNLRYQIRNNVDGIVILGTTGEAPTLTHQEKEKVIHIALEEVKGKAQLIVGTGSYSTSQTIEDTHLAKELGADAALIVTPYYNKPTQEGLFRHFQSIFKAVEIPICIYNIQGRTGQNIQTETLKRLTCFPHFVAVKESSGNLTQVDEVIQTFSHLKHFTVLSGDDHLTYPLMTLGGHGVISVVSNLVPLPMIQMVHSCLNKDFDQGRYWHQQLTSLFKGAFIETNPIPIKAAMHMVGMPSGPCRLPLCDLMPQNLEKLRLIVGEMPKEWYQ